MKIIFAGSSEFSASVFQSLIQSNHQIVALLTHLDKRADRGRNFKHSLCKQLALKNDIAIIQSNNVNQDNIIAQVESLNPDLIVVSSFGQMIGKKLLNLPKFGCLNTHASILPKYRGASPIQSVILNGETQTGVSMMKMNAKMDEGDVCMINKIPVHSDETTSSLEKKLMVVASNLTLKTLQAIENKTAQFIKQNENEATYCKKIKKNDAKLSFAENGNLLEQKIRAFNPSPIAFCDFNFFNQSVLLRIHLAKVVNVTAIQPLFNEISFDNLKSGGLIYTKNRIFVYTENQQFLELLAVQLPNKNVISGANFVGSTIQKIKSSYSNLSLNDLYLS